MTGEDKATLKGHKVWVTDIHFSPDGKSFVSVSSDIKVCISLFSLGFFKKYFNSKYQYFISQSICFVLSL